MLFSPIITRQPSLYYLIVSMALAMPVAATLLLSNQALRPIPLGDYLSYECQTKGTQHTDATFKVLTLTSTYALELADTLCRAPEIASRYRSVNISWHPRAYLKPQHILGGQYHLLWNRRHVVVGLVPEVYEYYRPIVDSPHYELFWLTHGEPVAMSKAFFADKILGLSADQQSQTFFQRPLNALRHAGIELKDEQKRFYPSMSALYEAFVRGDVDIMTSGQNQGMTNTLGVSDLTLTLLADDVPSGSWFLRRDIASDELSCAVARTLDIFKPMFKQSAHVLLGDAC